MDIVAGERGGYRVSVEVYKEQEDLDRPSRSQIGGALFREAPTAERRAEVVGVETSAERRWYPRGRDYAFEQVLLRKIRDASCCK